MRRFESGSRPFRSWFGESEDLSEVVQRAAHVPPVQSWAEVDARSTLQPYGHLTLT